MISKMKFGVLDRPFFKLELLEPWEGDEVCFVDFRVKGLWKGEGKV